MLPDKLHARLAMRHFSGSLRKLSSDNPRIDFASNDYLGFSTLLQVDHYGKHGATGSRLLSGNSILHEQVERQVAHFHNVQESLLFNSGYCANLGLLAAVTDRMDLIIYDELVHASIRDGISLSHAKALKYHHNDLAHLKILLDKFHNNESREVYVVTESVFSMDGDQPDLVALVDLISRYDNVHLILDEAHALGVLGDNGQGLAQHLGLEKSIFARVVTFGKALGSHGAAILCSTDLKQFLINYCRSFIYTTALPPYAIRVIAAGYDLLSNSRDQVTQLQDNIGYFNDQLIQLGLRLRFCESDTAIQTCIIPGNGTVKKVAQQLQKLGYNIKPIMSPTVAQGQERIRICLHSYNFKKDIHAMLQQLTKLI